MIKNAFSRSVCPYLSFLHTVKYSDLFVLELDLIAMWPINRKAVADFGGLGTGLFAGR